MTPVIHAENLGKKYIIGHQRQERYTALCLPGRSPRRSLVA